jgi:glycosyltransferase involved in cell wall biosynthesis
MNLRLPQPYLNTYPVLEQNNLSVKPTFDVCVLLPCYNNLEGLKTSLESISYHAGGLAIVVVDDGSPIPVEAAALSQTANIPFKVYVVRLEKNRGITEALNTGLQWILANLKVPYIARLDAGDTCKDKRFYQQVAFLNQNPHVGLLGSWCVFQNPFTGFQYTYYTPTQHKAILTEMHSRNVFIHPTVMFRTNLLEVVGLYPTDFPYVEDYALFFKMLHKTKGAILNDVLVTCEINTKGISITNRQNQLKGRQKVVVEFGSGAFRKFLGICKLYALRVIPYKIILQLKSK